MAKTFKCPFCEKRFTDKEELYYHIEKDHPESLKDGYSAARIYFNYTNKKDHGNCVICKHETEWNEKTRKYMRFCSENCKNEYVKQMKNRMLNVYGKIHLLDDPKKQREMLQSRSISGEYQFKDGGKHSYTGSYERSFLEFLDKVMEFSSLDVVSPCPFTFYYTYEGKELFYIPDIYIPSLNLIVEIKDGGDNPNTHPKIQAVDKVKEKLKDDLMRKGSYNYLKITNKDNFEFIAFLIELKNRDEDEKKPLIRIAESMSLDIERNNNKECVLQEAVDTSLAVPSFDGHSTQFLHNYPYISYMMERDVSDFPVAAYYIKSPFMDWGLQIIDDGSAKLKGEQVKLRKTTHSNERVIDFIIIANKLGEFKDSNYLISNVSDIFSKDDVVLVRDGRRDSDRMGIYERMKDNFKDLLERTTKGFLNENTELIEEEIYDRDEYGVFCKTLLGEVYYRNEEFMLATTPVQSANMIDMYEVYFIHDMVDRLRSKGGHNGL